MKSSLEKLLAFLILPVWCVGQSPRTADIFRKLGVPGSNDKDAVIYPLEFHSDGLVSGLQATPAIAFPIQCSSSGSTFVNIVDETPEHSGVFRIKDRHVQAFQLEAVSDLHSVHHLDFFPDGDGDDFLVTARPGKRSTEVEHGNPPSYIVRFDKDGQHTGSILLENKDNLTRLAVLPSGEFLVAGYNEAGNQPELLLFNERGQLMKLLDQPMTPKERSAGGWVGNSTTFVARGDTVLVWRAQSRDPLLEGGKEGAYREIRLALPPGSAIAGVMPSDDRIVVQLSSDAQQANQVLNTRELAYYEFDRLDGSVVRRLAVAGETIWLIACRTDGKYLGYRKDSKSGGLIQFSAQ